VHRATNDGANIKPFTAGLAANASPRQIIADDTASPRIFLATTVGAYVLELEEECRADFNNDGFANSQDFFDFLVAFFALDPAADFNNDTFVNSQDYFDFITVFFSGCP